jgi:hypothetical protein
MRAHKHHKSAQPASRLRPGQDIILPPPRSTFPDVGMTLSSYSSSQSSANAVRQPLPSLAGVRPARKRRFITLKRAVVTLLIVVLAIGGWLGFKFAYNAHKLFGGNIFSALSTTKLRGEDSGRVNILLAGNSADDPGHQGAQLTDSIMIMSIDTKNNTAFLISVTRSMLSVAYRLIFRAVTRVVCMIPVLIIQPMDHW